MPGMDGNGPRGMGQMAGRGFGRCRVGPALQDNVPSSVQVREDAVTPIEKPDHFPSQPLRCGAGRGGSPFGCGRGRVFAGGRRIAVNQEKDVS